MKHKTSELSGALLDAAVALAEGWIAEGDYGLPMWRSPLIDGTFTMTQLMCPAFSSDWREGGPIIERERIAILQNDSTSAAFYLRRYEVGQRDTGFFADGQPDLITYININDVRIWIGRTPLIAAMRAKVASKFGDEVELP